MSICVSGYISDLKFLQHWRSLLLSSGLWWRVVWYMGTIISEHAPSIFRVEGRTVLPWRWTYQTPQIITTYIPKYMVLQPRDLNLHSYICWMVLEENGQVVNPLLTRKWIDVKQKTYQWDQCIKILVHHQNKMENHKNLLAESTTSEIKISFSKFSMTKLNLSSFFLQQTKF